MNELTLHQPEKIKVETFPPRQRGRLYIQAKLGALMPAKTRQEAGARKGKSASPREAPFASAAMARFRKVAKAESKIDAYFESASGGGEPVEMSTAGFINFVGSGGVIASRHNNGILAVEWYTPKKYLDAATPTKKRAALGKALRAASLAFKDGRKDYCKAFELATAMVENYWNLGNELRRLSEAGALHFGTLGNKTYQVKLSELGVNKLLSSRTQKLAELSKAELHEGIEKAFDEQTCKLPTLGGAISSAVHVGQNTGQPEWYTPTDILDAAKKAMGGIDQHFHI